MKQTWSTGERVFKDDYNRRMKMFNALVGSVALYGAEIWGWGNEERMDGIKRKYVKWILGLDRRTPNYILVEETKMKELNLEAMERAIKYEETARKSEKRIVTECIKEIERKGKGKEQSEWEKKRRAVMERANMGKEELREKREGGEGIGKEIIERIRGKAKEMRRNKIAESKYNNVYKNIKVESVPGYLLGKKKKKDRSLIARYRCGNEMRGG